MNNKRLRTILKKKPVKGPILYWMSRDQRVEDNWALIYAQEEALKHKQPLIVIFCLQSKFINASERSYKFMISGLKDVEKSLKSKKIPFILINGPPGEELPKFIDEYSISHLITDFSPLRIKKNWKKNIKKEIEITFTEVDAHNIIPCWEASEKKEYAAYTLRPKISKLLNEFLDSFPDVKTHPYKPNFEYNKPDWDNLSQLIARDKKDFDLKFPPGEKAAKNLLSNFLENKLKNYISNRNNPNIEATSNLSPYLHFGQISAQKVVLEARKVKAISTLKGTFYDEVIVRRELSDNFCYFEPDYDKFEGFHKWARETLNAHQKDKREYVYTLEEFENANTHDDLWNAAQLQMVKIGKMHGYLRMYWGKKILEWTEVPEDAIAIANYLNNKYELDGRDPNGYVGVAWSIGGVHDRAWKERKIFGKIRFMSYNGMKRKFNISKYIENFIK